MTALGQKRYAECPRRLTSRTACRPAASVCRRQWAARGDSTLPPPRRRMSTTSTSGDLSPGGPDLEAKRLAALHQCLQARSGRTFQQQRAVALKCASGQPSEPGIWVPLRSCRGVVGLIDDDETQSWNPCENGRPRSDDNGRSPALSPTSALARAAGPSRCEQRIPPRSQRLLEIPLQSVRSVRSREPTRWHPDPYEWFQRSRPK